MEAVRSSKSRLTTLHRFCAQPNCTDGDSGHRSELLRNNLRQRLWHDIQDYAKRRFDDALHLLFPTELR